MIPSGLDDQTPRVHDEGSINWKEAHGCHYTASLFQAHVQVQTCVAQQQPCCFFFVERFFLEDFFFSASTTAGASTTAASVATSSSGAGAGTATKLSISSCVSAPPCKSLAKTSGDTLTRVVSTGAASWKIAPAGSSTKATGISATYWSSCSTATYGCGCSRLPDSIGTVATTGAGIAAADIGT